MEQAPRPAAKGEFQMEMTFDRREHVLCATVTGRLDGEGLQPQISLVQERRKTNARFYDHERTES